MKIVILICLHILKETCFSFLAFSCVMAVGLSCVHTVLLRTICVLQLKYIELILQICRFGQLTYMEITLNALCKMILMMLVLHPVYVKCLVCGFAFIGPFSTSSVQVLLAILCVFIDMLLHLFYIYYDNNFSSVFIRYTGLCFFF